MVRIQAPLTLFPVKTKAVALAAENQESDESGWTYKVIENAAGLFVVQIFDEAGEFVGTL